jgi:hypothetical protein
VGFKIQEFCVALKIRAIMLASGSGSGMDQSCDQFSAKQAQHVRLQIMCRANEGESTPLRQLLKALPDSSPNLYIRTDAHNRGNLKPGNELTVYYFNML